MKTKRFLASLLAALFVMSVFHIGCNRDVDGVTVDPSIDYIREIDGTATFTHTISPSNAKNKSVNWKSGDPSIATVEGGVVIGIKEGFTSISCTAVDGNFQGVATICVGDLDGTFYGSFTDKNGNILAENIAVETKRSTTKRGDISIPKSFDAMPQDITFEKANYEDTEASGIPIISVFKEMTLDNGTTAKITGGYIYGQTFTFDMEIGAVPYTYTGRKK